MSHWPTRFNEQKAQAVDIDNVYFVPTYVNALTFLLSKDLNVLIFPRPVAIFSTMKKTKNEKENLISLVSRNALLTENQVATATPKVTTATTWGRCGGRVVSVPSTLTMRVWILLKPSFFLLKRGRADPLKIASLATAKQQQHYLLLQLHQSIIVKCNNNNIIITHLNC